MQPKFMAKQIVATRGITDLLDRGVLTTEQTHGMLDKHFSGDWGATCAEDQETNNEALINGDRIISAYPIDESKECKGWGVNCVWVITEWDRSVTTVLLPEEY